jgi:hypothetical protein
MKIHLLNKSLVLGIIFLFISTAIAPTINFNSVKATSDNEFVEVTSQACGIKGFNDQKVKLTKQQYQDLENYLKEFRERLNKTATREESVPIFKGAVTELNKYGLLPKGMSVEQAQSLTTGGYWNYKNQKLIENIFKTNQGNSTNLIDNYFCLVAGRTDGSEFMNFIIKLLFYADFIVYESIDFLVILYILGLFFQGKLFDRIFNNIVNFFDESRNFFDNCFGNYLTYLNIKRSLMIGCNIAFSGGEGWVHTIGLNGIKKINGTLFGQIPYLFKEIGIYYLYPQGIKYFVGLKIFDNSSGHFFLGSAFHVKIGLSPLYP